MNASGKAPPTATLRPDGSSAGNPHDSMKAPAMQCIPSCGPKATALALSRKLNRACSPKRTNPGQSGYLNLGENIVRRFAHSEGYSSKVSYTTTLTVGRKSWRVSLRKSHRCIRCNAPITRRTKHAHTKLNLAVNALGELIAWCACPKCRKVTPLKMEGATFTPRPFMIQK